MVDDLTAVFLAAGMSSRFGGKIKALTKVGPNGETLLELSMIQAQEAGFNNFVIIASDKTLNFLEAEFQYSHDEIPISYAIQKTPEHREKPFGTTHALLAAKKLVKGPFIVLNSDDLYGLHTLKLMGDYLTTNKECYCMPAYHLKNTLPEVGIVNRGHIKEKNGYLMKIVERFNISKKDIPKKFSGDELISMNLFGLQHVFLEHSEKEFEEFLKEIGDDPAKECLLPHTLSNFIKKHKVKFAVISTQDKPIGLTNPEDEEKVRELLSKS